MILQGETNHAQNLSRSVTDALQRIAIENGVPVINAVLSFDNEEQARARCLENKSIVEPKPRAQRWKSRTFCQKSYQPRSDGFQTAEG